MTGSVMYLSGPISHSDPAQVERHKQAFRDAAQALRARGLTVVSPVELCPEDGYPWEWYMRRCIAALVTCDEIIEMPGSVDSKGAMMEIGIAQDLGMRRRWLPRLLEQLDSEAAVREAVAKRASR